jgi:exopolysaccharide biosynthesis protein
MPVKNAESVWKKHMTVARDVVFIILFLASVVGWIRSETIKKTKLETQVEILTQKLQDNTKELEKINDILTEQQTLNGKIIQYMEMR